MTALWEIQKAVYSILTGDATLMGMAKGIFDDVPDGQDFPYVTIGEATETRFNTFGRDGKDATLTLHIWSRSAGFKEALNILDRINTLLDDAALAVTGYSTVYIRYEDAQTLHDPDGITRHVAARYRVVVQKV